VVGSWVLVSSFFREGTEGDSYQERASGAAVRAVSIYEEGNIYLEDGSCDGSEGSAWFGDVGLPEESEGSSVYVFSTGYLEDGSCPEDTSCEKIEVDFISNSEATFTRMQESNYPSEGEYYSQTDTGSLIKISDEDADNIIFDDSSMAYSNYDGEKAIDEKATCFTYISEGYEQTMTDDGEEYTETGFWDQLIIETETGEFEYNKYIELDAYGFIYEGDSDLDVEAYFDEGNFFEVDFDGDYFGGPGLENLIEESDYTIDTLTFSNGNFTVVGSGDDGEEEGDTLDFNITINPSSAVVDETVF
jgi:hypothetical protein